MPITSRLALLLALAAASCSSTSAIKCTEQATCAPLGAVCLDGICHKPDEPGLDLGGLDFATPDDSGAPDLAPMCIESAACTSATGPICDTTLGTCRGCIAGECATATPVCLVGGAQAGACVECGIDLDCAGQRKLCDLATHACVPCTADSQCATGVCDAGLCARDTDILYVDINKAPCTGADGTKAKPYCQINSAIATGKPFVFVAGSATFYDPITIGTGTHPPVRVIGPGASASPPAFVEKNTGPAIAITTLAGETSKLTVDGMVVYAYSASGPGIHPPAIQCATSGTGLAELLVRGSKIGSPDGPALDMNGCAVTITKTLISSGSFGLATAGGGSLVVRGDRFEYNKTGMFKLGGTTTYTIENNLFVNNGTIGSPATIYLPDTNVGVFRFNNLADNVLGNAPMVDCGAAAAKLIEGNLLRGNTTSTSFTGNCTLVNTITPVGDTTGTPASFNLDGNYKLQAFANALACCIDKLSAGPATDYDGTPRPKGAGFDIGAHELQ